MPGAAAKAFSSLPPLWPNPIECRQEYEHHQRDLKVRIDEHQAAELIKPDAVGVNVHSLLLQPERDEAGAPDGRDERKGEGHATELRQHATSGRDQPAEDAIWVTRRHGVGE